MQHSLKLSAKTIAATMIAALATAVTGFAQNPATANDTADIIINQLLSEIIVKAKKPAVTVTPDKTVYNLTSTVMGESGTFLDALSSIPGVSVGSDGTVSLYGNSGATVNIDGKTVFLKGLELVNYLRTLPADAVSTITLRTTAGARDDASDKNGIIEINTRRVSRRGITIGLNGSMAAGRNLESNGSLSLDVNTGRSEFSMLYSLFAGRRRIHLDINRSFITDEDRMLQTSSRRRTDNINALKAGWRYTLAEHTTLETALSLSRNSRNEVGRMDTRIPVLAETGRSDNHTRQHWHNLMADVCLDHRFGSGSLLNISANFLRYTTSERQLLESTSPDTLGSRVSGRVRWLIGRADFTHPFSEVLKLQTGIKNAFVAIRNGGRYYDRTDGADWIINRDLSSTFRYRANTFAVYAQLSFTRGRLDATAGVRFENENLRGDFSGNEVTTDSVYRVATLSIVPTAELKYMINGTTALALSYSRRIDRPNYIDLNPFIYVFDEYTHAGGNIGLRSSTYDHFQLAVSTGRLQAAIFLSYSDDAIMKSYHEISDRCVYVAAENLPYHLQTGLRVILANRPIGRRCDITATAIGLFNRYDRCDGAVRESTRLFTPIISLDSRFDLGKGWHAELRGSFTGSMAYGQVMLSPSGNVGGAVRKNLMNGNASVTLFVHDIFATDKTVTRIRLGQRSSRYKETEFRRMVGISLSYRFNSGRKPASPNERKGPEELERL